MNRQSFKHLAAYRFIYFALAILFVLCFLAISTWSGRENSLPNIPLYVLGFPIIFISLCGGLAQPNSIDYLSGIKSFNGDIQMRLRRPDSNLRALINEGGITPSDYVSYYGFNAAMPVYVEGEAVKTYEKTWVFNPFQLLEEPIITQRREEIATRALVNRWQNDVYVIQAKGQFDDRFDGWMKIFSRYYLFDKQFENEEYLIIHLVKK